MSPTPPDGPIPLADRRDYSRGALDERTVSPDPIEQFADWFAQARDAALPDVDAMTLATATPDGVPSARIVLLKGFDGRGFTFFSDFRSQKGRELSSNPRAALVVYWSALERQVRISGAVTRLPDDESEAYFRTRPLESRIGAWASTQSAPLAGRADLEESVRKITARFSGGDVPLPPHWGGYRVEPVAIEFWQGRAGRLHDRIRYRATPRGWTIKRLSP